MKSKIIFSLTTTHLRIKYLKIVIESLLDQKAPADEIQLYISEAPYLFDKGIKKNEVPRFLKKFEKEKKILINYTENIGPFRKLIPYLKQNMNKNVTRMKKKIIKNMI